MDPPYRFGPLEIDAAARSVRRDGRPVPIEPRPFDVLVHLVRAGGRVVRTEELLAEVWGDARGSVGALARAVMKLRQAIGPCGGHAFVRTAARVGYRFVAPPEADDAPVRPLTVALLPVENATGDATLDWIGLGLVALAARDLEARSRLVPVSTASLLTALQGARAAGESGDAPLRRATGAAIVVHARVTRAPGGALRLAHEARGAGVRPPAVTAATPVQLAARWADALADALDPDRPAPPVAAHRHDPLAEEAFARGMQALATHRWPRAANLLRMALDLEPGHVEAQLEHLRALSNLGDPDLLPTAQRLLEQAERVGDRLLAARVHQALGRFHLNCSQYTQADHHLACSLELANGRGGADWTARTLMLQASNANIALQHDKAVEIVQRMYQQCDRSGDRVLRVAGLVIEAMAVAAGGDRERAVGLSMEAARRAREVHAHSYIVDACDNAAWELARLGRLGEAASCAEEAVAAALAAGDPTHAWDSMPTLCWTYALAGLPAAAAHAIERMPPAEQSARPLYVWAAQALLALADGRADDAVQASGVALQLAREGASGYDEALVLPWHVDALVLAGRLDEAQAELAAADAPHLAGSANLAAQVAHGRALLAHARGAIDEARAELVALAEARPAPLWLGWACIDLAWLDAEAGRADAAAAWLARVPRPLAEHPLVQATRERIGGTGMAPLPFLRTRSVQPRLATSVRMS